MLLCRMNISMRRIYPNRVQERHHKDDGDRRGNPANARMMNNAIFSDQLEEKHKKERGNFFQVGKSEKKCTKEEFVQLVKITDGVENGYVKGTPCKFKPNKCKKKINVTNLNVQDNSNDKVEKEIDVTELWSYLSHVHNSEGSRLRYKIGQIMDTRSAKCQAEMENHTHGDREQSRGGEKDKFNYDEYKQMVKYILPSMADNKIKYSWCVLKSNLNCEGEEINYKEFSSFINLKGGNDENSYVNKIVCSKLKNKMLKYNFNPEDVKLKTINYIDNVRLKASEFSKQFKEIISERELADLFKGKDKIKIDELEKYVMEIIEERGKDIPHPRGGQSGPNSDYSSQESENKSKGTKKQEGLTNFNMKAYISTLLTNKDHEVSVDHFIQNLNIDYEMLNSQNKSIKDAYDFYSRNIPPSEVVGELYAEELNKEEIKRAKFLIEEIDYSVRNNFKSNYLGTKKEKNKMDSQVSYLSIYEIFKHLDVDKDSYITKEDLHKSFQKLKIKDISNTDVNILLKYIDTEKKGFINVNDFLSNYQLEEKSMLTWIKNTNKPYFEFVKNLQRERYNSGKGARERSSSEHVLNNRNANIAKKHDDVIANYNLQLDPFCPSYVIRERIRDNFMPKKEDFLSKHLNATRFHLTQYKNTNNLVQPVENSDLYMSENLRFKTTYNLNYNKS
ncbi:hypothetical protein PCYB_094360 [Plasmodium cynomolgi strain B]|uniref:EF-hand domain-containing protein n=1 Tax=Plasmodium cynomolgi (strain B) TaxID=1120755 RepID=K6VBT4_PLACD|nr:hypothetical protein PCYB_094360 [Plasmodium cynomolgi strain B]GAB66652.1 hypothetical protein PCYB_094360 [Plasmodium cynomolgi strain B]